MYNRIPRGIAATYDMCISEETVKKAIDDLETAGKRFDGCK